MKFFKITLTLLFLVQFSFASQPSKEDVTQTEANTATKISKLKSDIKVLNESPDLLVRGIPKVGEFINEDKPDDALPIMRETFPLIFSKVVEYGLERFVIDVSDLTRTIPDMFISMQKLVREVDPDKLTEFGRDFEDIMQGLLFVINEGLPIVRKVNKDIDDVFNKIKGLNFIFS